MSKIKAASTSSETAVNAEKDLQLVRQQAEMKAGQAMIREVSRKVTEQREQAQSDNRDSNKDTDEDQPRDTAEISRTRTYAYTDETGSRDEVLEWILEMAGKDWEAFLKWLPDPGIPLPDQLRELSKLYLSLLEAILKYAEGDNLAEQLERLDSLLAQKLELVIDKNLEQLISLLEETGETTVLDSIRSSLYRQTAGRTLSPQAAHILFTQEPSARYKTAGPSATSPSFSGEGMIYQSSRKQNARFQQVYHTQQSSLKEQLRQRNEIISNARKGITENTFRQTRTVSCSGKELEIANRFAAHINGRGNLFQNPDISARNEEVTGLLAAVMVIKGQVYAGDGDSGQTSSLALTLQNAIGKIIKQYLGQKGAADVYYHTLTTCQKMKNPQKAIQEGQNYAYQQFRAKQKDPAFQKSAHYSRESGFFRALLKKLSPEKEYALGADVLQKDWKNFSYLMGAVQNSSYLARMESHSPWGALAGIHAQHADASEITAKILIGVTVAIIAGILAAVWLQPF